MKRLCITLLGLLLFTTIVSAQANAAWEIIIAEPTTGAIYTLTAEGIQTGTTIDAITEFDVTYGYMLSPDRRYLAFIGQNYNETDAATMGLYVADLEAGTCCTLLADPLNSALTDIIPGRFNPEGNLLVVLLYSSTPDAQGNLPEALVTIFDVTTGSVAHNMSVSRLANPYGAGSVAGALIGGWGERGVQLVGSCIACEPQQEGSWQYWTPQSDELTEPIEPFGFNWQFLPGTSEAIRSTQNTAFDYDPEVMAYFPPSNVVEYLLPGGALDDPEVIYFNPDNLHIASAFWVNDGRGVLISHGDAHDQTQPSEEGYVLLRDGTLLPVQLPPSQYFLAATTDGWLMADYQSQTFIHYTVADDGTINASELDKFVNYVATISLPILGTSVSEPSFAPINP